jgi:hypothetical protein
MYDRSETCFQLFALHLCSLCGHCVGPLSGETDDRGAMPNYVAICAMVAIYSAGAGGN